MMQQPSLFDTAPTSLQGEAGRVVESPAEYELALLPRERAMPKRRVQFTTPEDVALYFQPLFEGLPVEAFVVCAMNTRNDVIVYSELSRGGLSCSIVEPRAVFQFALLVNAACLVLLHNHPSGNLEPSKQDVAITKKLIDAGKLMDIPVHDHIIIAGRGFTSLAQRGLMP